MLLVSLLSAFALLCMFVPSVRTCLLAVDDSLDAHEASMALVALRALIFHCHIWSILTRLLSGKPFRESGPPQNMAQLIMLRHKVSHLVLRIPSTFQPPRSDPVQPAQTQECFAHAPVLTQLQHHTNAPASIAMDAVSKNIWLSTPLIPALRPHVLLRSIIRRSYFVALPLYFIFIYPRQLTVLILTLLKQTMYFTHTFRLSRTLLLFEFGLCDGFLYIYVD